MSKIDKFNRMIESFECDFSLIKEGEKTFSELDEKIKDSRYSLAEDMELMQELSTMLRHGQAEIHIVDEAQADKWIPCSERLPEDEQKLYWTTHEDGSVILHGYTERDGFILNWEVDDLDKRKRQGGVVAWIMIEKPQPYKKEGDADESN